MKAHLLVGYLLLGTIVGQTQSEATSSQLESQILSLEVSKEQFEMRRLQYESQLKACQDSLTRIGDSLSSLQRRLVEVKILETNADMNRALSKKPVTITLKVSAPYYPTKDNGMMSALRKDAKVTVLATEKKYFFRIKHKGVEGLINGDYLDFKGTPVEYYASSLVLLYNESGERVGVVYPGSTPSSSNYVPSTQSSSYQPSSGGSSGTTGKTIYTGPRGGKYHYSASGKKVYEKKKRN